MHHSSPSPGSSIEAMNQCLGQRFCSVIPFMDLGLGHTSSCAQQSDHSTQLIRYRYSYNVPSKKPCLLHSCVYLFRLAGLFRKWGRCRNETTQYRNDSWFMWVANLMEFWEPLILRHHLYIIPSYMSYPQQIWCNSPSHFLFFSHLAPTVLQPATKATYWKWCKWCHHHAFKPILPAFVLFIQWLQPWKKDLPSRKVTWKWQTGKSQFFPRGYIFKWWMFHCHVCFRGLYLFETSGKHITLDSGQYLLSTSGSHQLERMQ